MKLVSQKVAKKKYQIEAYEACPCNSGDKYKFCCYKKSFESQTVNINQMDHEFKKIFKESDFKECFGFDETECSSTIVRAHSLQNNGVLSHIIYKNHVYQFSSNYQKGVYKNNFEKIGRNQASTFFGFCSNHDDNYFKIIETQKYQNIEENNYFYAFRALVHEMHKKKRMISVYKEMYKKYPLLTRNVNYVNRSQNEKLNLRDLNIEYLKYRDMYNQKDYSELESFVLELPYRVGFAVSSYAAVYRDMKREIACDVYSGEKQEVPALAITVTPKEESTLIIVSRHKSHDCYRKLLEQLQREKNVKYLLEYLSWAILETTENIFFSIPIIDTLSGNNRKELIQAFMSSLTLDPYERAITMDYKLNLFELLRFK